MWGAQSSLPPNLGPARLIVGGYHRSAAFTDNGIRVWETAESITIPVPTDAVDYFALGAGHIIVRFGDGSIGIWGANHYGQLNTPSGLPLIRHVGTGAFHSIAALMPSETNLLATMSYGRGFRTRGSIGELSIFPNPSVDYLTVQFDLEETDHIVAEIFDVAGRSRRSVTPEASGPGRHELQIPVADLAIGIYILRIKGYYGSQSSLFATSR